MENELGTAPEMQSGETTINPEVVENSDEKVAKYEQIANDQKKRAEKAEKQAEDLQAEVEKLKVSTATGMSVTAVNDEIKRLANEHNIDEGFLASLVSTVQKTTKDEIQRELEKDYAPKITKMEQEREMEKAEKKFETIFQDTLKALPDYAGVVNKDVIKALVFSPSNAKKTVGEIIEETYSTAIAGRKSLEKANASREPEKVDVVNPTNADWDKIESDPTARAEWSKQTENVIRKYL